MEFNSDRNFPAPAGGGFLTFHENCRVLMGSITVPFHSIAIRHAKHEVHPYSRPVHTEPHSIDPARFPCQKFPTNLSRGAVKRQTEEWHNRGVHIGCSGRQTRRNMPGVA